MTNDLLASRAGAWDTGGVGLAKNRVTHLVTFCFLTGSVAMYREFERRRIIFDEAWRLFNIEIAKLSC